MKPEIMLSGHREETIARASDCGGEYVIAAQDTTYYNYTGHKQMEGPRLWVLLLRGNSPFRG
jgi:hypothetical protein